MPVCTVETNLSASQLPTDLAAKVSQLVAQVLNKSLERISVTVHAGLNMARNGSTDPTITVHLWSMNVFSEELNPVYSEKIFNFFQQEIPSVPSNRIAMLFHAIDPSAPQSRH